MISAWNLVWIVPLAACFGILILAIASSGGDK